jgi:mono/diheme cytochrome c family protein
MKINRAAKFSSPIVLVHAACIILALGILFLNSGCQSDSPLAMQQANYPKDKVDAAVLFKENCAKCHGMDGRAKTFHGRLVGAQNFTDAKWRTNVTDEEMSNAIKKGPEAMPAFEKKLSQAEIDALVAYVRSFKQAQ